MSPENKVILIEKYLADLKLRDSYNSTHIEGNTISLGDTYTILIDGLTPKNRTYKLTEVNEVANYKNIWEFILNFLYNKKPELSRVFILDLHQFLMQGILLNAGRFRTENVAIAGSLIKTTRPELIVQEIDNWLFRFHQIDPTTMSQKEKIETILCFHVEFEAIHPFLDGNGRTGRMLMNVQMLLWGLPPFIILQDNRSEYLDFMRDASLDALDGWKNKTNINKFYQIVKNYLNFEMQRLEDFNLAVNDLTHF